MQDKPIRVNTKPSHLGEEKICHIYLNRPLARRELQSLFWCDVREIYDFHPFWQIFQIRFRKFLIFPPIMTQLKVSLYPDLMRTFSFSFRMKFFRILRLDND